MKLVTMSLQARTMNVVKPIERKRPRRTLGTAELCAPFKFDSGIAMLLVRGSSILHNGKQVAVRISEPGDLCAVGSDQNTGRILRKMCKSLPFDAALTQCAHDCAEICNGKAQYRVRRWLGGRHRRH